MEMVDEEFLTATEDFIKRANTADKPFFVWFNATRMHVWTHLKKESQGKTGHGIYPDGIVEHDGHAGHLLDLLDELNIADNTIVVYGTDKGAEGNGPRKEIFYLTDVGQLAAVRYEDYKGALHNPGSAWNRRLEDPVHPPLAWPSLVDLRSDPSAAHQSHGLAKQPKAWAIRMLTGPTAPDVEKNKNNDYKTSFTR